MKKNIILQNYPYIVLLEKAGATSDEILKLLKKKTGVTISRAFLRKTINEILEKTVVKNANKIICFYPFNDDDKIDYQHFAVEQHGLWFITAEAKNTIPQELIITINNLNSLKTYNSKLMAKWIIQEFSIPDEQLLTNADPTIIIDTPTTIYQLVNEISIKSRIKYFEWIMKVN